MFLVKKTGEYRFCFDRRPLNEVTKYDSYPMENVDSLIDNEKGILSNSVKRRI